MDIHQPHVLYIEDHDDTRELVIFGLTELNYLVTTSSNIKDALKLAHERQFDLYMLDSWLPDGSGIDLCTRLREFDQNTPIMFFSGAAYEADKQAAINSGAQRYLVKPMDLDVLCCEVSKLLGPFCKKAKTGEAPAVSHSGLADSDNTVDVNSLVSTVAT